MKYYLCALAASRVVSFLCRHWLTLDQWEKLSKIAAVFVGGAWVWMNYWRGRTFKSRLELEVSASIKRLEDKLQIAGKVVAKNIGLSKIELEKYGSGIVYSLYTEDGTSSKGVVATELDVVTEVFKDHQWIEPGETVSDEFFSILSADNSCIAVELRVNQLGRSQFWGRIRSKADATAEEIARRNTQWSANAVLPVDAFVVEAPKQSFLMRLIDGL